ncbi:hypothetical protein RV09_GL001458 [Enterococcus moraviensis]|nr:hypothetical protein RV09_GL001458 [Enterococcus moraviensis]
MFDFNYSTNSSEFTKRFINEHPGEIPVYGASKKEDEISYGFVQDNLSDVKYFENCLTVSIDGFAGYVFYRKHKFSLSEKVRPLILKGKYEGKIDLLYLKYILEPLFRKHIKGRKGIKGKNEYTKLPLGTIKKLTISIPSDEDNVFNINIQKEIASKFKNISEYKKKIESNILKLENNSVELVKNFNYVSMSIDEIFCFSKGKNASKYTKTYLNNPKNIGIYPCYSGQIYNNGIIGMMNSFDFDFPKGCLRIVTVGNTGRTTIVSGKFSLSQNNCIIYLKSEYENLIDLGFIKYSIEIELSKISKGQKHKSLLKSAILSLKINIPVDKYGKLDVIAQQKISEQYELLNDYKNKIKEASSLISRNSVTY